MVTVLFAMSGMVLFPEPEVPFVTGMLSLLAVGRIVNLLPSGQQVKLVSHGMCSTHVSVRQAKFSPSTYLCATVKTGTILLAI